MYIAGLILVACLTPACAVQTDDVDDEVVGAAQSEIADGETYMIRNLNSSKCLVPNVDPYTSSPSAPVAQHPCWDTGVELGAWAFLATSSGYFRIRNRLHDNYLDVAHSYYGNGALVWLWDYVAGSNQEWKPEPRGGGFQLRARHSGRCLDVTDFSVADNARLQQWDCSGGRNQIFFLDWPGL